MQAFFMYRYDINSKVDFLIQKAKIKPNSAGFLFASICTPAKLTLLKLIDGMVR
ncbi:hypothetical protein [Providencia manganoxydans]|uniref:hypothetical protein n=1 Tax=Providencia manganoxydans TaxID=2923283 RepID=UPI0034E601CA